MALLLSQSTAFAQYDRIPGRIGSSGRAVLRGNVHPKAQPQYDSGRVEPDLKMSLITLAFKPSPAQQAALNALLAEQQDRSSPNYHRWLTPEQYADQFGLSHEDFDKIMSWLQSCSLSIDYSARGRNSISFSGTAHNVELAFGTEIHRYRVDGEIHFANSTDPSIPAELASVVLGLRGLDDFRMKPPTIRKRDSADASHSVPAHPEYTYPNGTHVLVPDDLATIYDIAPLYAIGINGSGQRIVIAGQSDISLSDIATFRNGILPSNVPQVVLVPGSSDPGITVNENEADLDLEWVGAVARNATIIYVNSTSVLASAAYAISENLAPIVSISFGLCEQDQTASTLSLVETAAQQANLQGITLLSASGDTGAAGCDSETSSQASHGLGVWFPASLPEVTAVGGTEFSEGIGHYWSSANSGTGASALSYIPEIAWNDSTLGNLSASGGGISTLYSKPVWQTGPGVPNDGVRDVPDVAMTASPNHDPYVIISGGAANLYGGTSAATPVFAGIIALLNQYYGSKGEGNINPNLYRIPQTSAFHDIVSGNNIIPCVLGTPNCTTGSFGYSAAPGYDLVTGLGSVDVYNLVVNWNTPTPASNVVPTCNPNPVYEQQPNSQGYSWLYTITLTETAGVATSLTGFTINGTDYSSQIVSYFGTPTITARGTVSANIQQKGLTVPTNQVFVFTGVDAGGRQWSQQLSVPFEGTAASLLTIQTSPSGLQFSIDGGTLQTAPQTLSLVTGSTHSIAVPTPQPGATGTQYLFAGWSDGGAASHSFMVNASGTLTATFQTQYQLTLSASPATWGIVTPASGAFYNSGAVVPVTATPNSGYSFAGWTGAVANASAASTTVTMSSPQMVAANFRIPAIQIPQTINFGPLSNVAFGASPISLTATASSGLPVSFASATPSVCTVSGFTVAILTTGTCSIIASQPGNTNYLGAAPVTQTFTVSAASSAPVVTQGGVVPLYSSTPVIQPGSWISIYGSNLANATTVWSGDFPTSLGGVSVTINSKPGYLWFVSPGQITLQAPDDTATGVVPVIVTTPNGTATSTVTLAQYAPSFLLQSDAKHVVAIVTTPGSLGNSGSGYDVIGLSRPAKAGEIVQIYGVGFGPTNTAVPSGVAYSSATATTNPVQVTIGGASVPQADVQFSGLIEAGLYQLNVLVPSNLGTGDQQIVASTGGPQTQSNVLLSLQ